MGNALKNCRGFYYVLVVLLLTTLTGCGHWDGDGGSEEREVTLTSVTVTPADQSVINGLTRQFTATAIYSDGTSKDITTTATWASTTAAAKVDLDGLATGESAGSSTITATLGGQSGSTNLIVTPATLNAITVTPTNPTVVNGLTRQFMATGTYSDGTSQDITAAVIWASGTTAVATVNSGGLATSALRPAFRPLPPLWLARQGAPP